MKIKIVKVKILGETITWNYGDDYADVRRHIVTDYSDFEEVDDYNYRRIEDFVKDFNEKRSKDNEYFIIVTNDSISIQSTIQLIEEKYRKLLKEIEERDKLELAKREKEKANRAAKKIERLKKQLEKAEKEKVGEV